MQPKLRFQVLTDKRFRPTDGDFIVRMALTVGVSDLAEVLPLHLCIVIDRSISMQGSKLTQAKEAAQAVIQALSSGDTFSVLAFGSTVEVLSGAGLATDHAKHKAVQAITALDASGVTRMDLALEQAYAQFAATDEDTMNTLIFLSDGAPTDGQGYMLGDEGLNHLTDTVSRAFGGQAITTSTIGLGDAEDCLAPFLERCGEMGGGIFCHADNPSVLRDRFMEAFHRVHATAVSDVIFRLEDVNGDVRRAVAVLPDIRVLPAQPAEDGAFLIDGGALQQGEEHAFLVEIVTPAGEEGKTKLCQIKANYRMDGMQQQTPSETPLIEYTSQDSLLDQPDHPILARYKGLYNAFQQAQKATENAREGGDPKKTKVLLRNAARTTRRLGLSKQTKVLETMADRLDQDGSLSANDLTAVTTAARKTKVLS